MLDKSYIFKINKIELLIQLLIIFFISTLFTIKDYKLGLSSVIGGMLSLLPNIFFIFLLNFFSKKISKKFFPWNFIFAEVIKIFITMILFILAFYLCCNFCLPILITWLLIKITQILVPTLIININVDRIKKYVQNRDF